MRRMLYVVGTLLIGVALAIAAGIRPDIPVEKLLPMYANEHSKFVTIDGLKVHYRDEGQGVPLVLLHGAPSSLHAFDGLTRELSQRYRVIRMDLPGYGLTGPSIAGDYSLEFYEKFLDAFLTAVRVDSCYIAGHSFGGHLAGEFAHAHPERVKKLVLIAAGGYPLKDDGILAVKMARSALLRPIVRYVTPRFFIAMNLREAYGGKQDVPGETVDRYYDLMRRTGNRGTFIAMSNREPGDISAHVKVLRLPTLILWGAADSIIPPGYAELFHRDIPESHVIMYPGVGHVPQEVIPERVAADMRAFL